MNEENIKIFKMEFKPKTVDTLKKICLIVGAIFILNGLTYLAGDPIFIFVYLIIGALFLLVYFLLKKKIVEFNSKNSVTVKPVVPAKNSRVSIAEKPVNRSSYIPPHTTVLAKPESERDYDLFPVYDSSDDTYLIYSYEQNLAFANTAVLTGNGGKEITFRQEPNNEADGEAIAVYFNDTKVGYLFKGKIKDMANDWINRDEPIIGYINKIDTTQNRATIKIGFYRSVDSLQIKKFKLTRITKKEDDFSSSRYNNISWCNDKDVVNYEFSADTDNYIITNECSEELGEIGSKAVEFINENENRIKFLRINNIGETDAGGYKADIEIFYK